MNQCHNNHITKLHFIFHTGWLISNFNERAISNPASLTLIDMVRRNYHTLNPARLVLTCIIKCENIIKHSHLSIKDALISTVAAEWQAGLTDWRRSGDFSLYKPPD